MNNEQERMRSAFHAYAYGLLRAGQRQEAIAQQLIEQGVEQSLAHDISSFAAVSYHSDRREALQNQLGRGLLFLIGGLLFTAFTYALAPGGPLFDCNRRNFLRVVSITGWRAAVGQQKA